MQESEHRPDPRELLEAFVASKRSERAFTALVENLRSLVYSSALRRTSRPQLAEEVTQDVFARLARQAEFRCRHPSLQAWMKLTEGDPNSAIDGTVSQAIMEAEPEQMIDGMAELRPDRISSLLSEWAEIDLQGVTTWLGQQAPSPKRDRAIAEFARRTAGFDREGAAQWTGEIQDDQLREETLREVEKR